MSPKNLQSVRWTFLFTSWLCELIHPSAGRLQLMCSNGWTNHNVKVTSHVSQYWVRIRRMNCNCSKLFRIINWNWYDYNASLMTTMTQILFSFLFPFFRFYLFQNLNLNRMQTNWNILSWNKGHAKVSLRPKARERDRNRLNSKEFKLLFD